MQARSAVLVILSALLVPGSLARVPGQENFPIVYVVYSPGGTPLARAVVGSEEPCPSLVGHAGASTASQLRGVGGSAMPYAFPIKVCEVPLPREAPAGSLTLGGKKLPKITRAPSKFAFIGDTGLRVKPKNRGTCTHPGPHRLYGIKQCEPEHVVPFDASLVKGAYQNLHDWPLKEQMDRAAREVPDLVLHVGDYLYRQGPCAQDQGCTSINHPTNASMPGEWGDNWHGWYSDFFEPSLELLAAAPWIMLRGNHERCDRGGHGFFLLIDPRPLPSDWTEAYCEDFTETYAVPFDAEQFIVMDDSFIQDLDTDHVCPDGQSEQSDALPASRFDDPDQKLSHEGIAEQIAFFRRQFRKVEASANRGLTNLLASHRPLLGVACHQGKYLTVDWTMQEALGESTLELISATIHGHVHWFQGLVFENQALPVEIVVGNGGTKLDKAKMVNTRAVEGLRVNGVRIERAFTSGFFGFSLMNLMPDGDYLLQSLQVGNHHDEALRCNAESLMWSTSIPAMVRRHGLRRLTGSSEIIV